MANNSVYVTTTEAKSGKSALILAIINLLLSKVNKVGIFRPIIYGSDAVTQDSDITLMLKYFKMDLTYDECYGLTIQEAKKLINNGQYDILIETILYKYQHLQEKCDFIVCEGTDFLGKDAVFEFELNAEIIVALGAPVIMILGSANLSLTQAQTLIQNAFMQSKEKGLHVISYIFNMTNFSSQDLDSIRKQLAKNFDIDEALLPLIYTVPNDPSIGLPTINDVKRWLKADVLYGHSRLDNQVQDFLVAAMHVGHFLNYLEEGQLIITPSDRSDLLLGSLSSRLSNAYPNIAGILLTGGLDIDQSLHKLLEGWTGVPVPILSVPHHTYKTMQILTELHGSILPEDSRKINVALGLFKKHIDEAELLKAMQTVESNFMTPQMFQYRLIESAQKSLKRIVLPEADDERVLRACEIIIQRAIAIPVLIGNKEKIHIEIKNYGLKLDGIEIIDPADSPYFDDFVETYYQLRKHKGVSPDIAKDRMLDPTYFSTMLVHKNLAHGMVGGAVNTTAHTLKPAFEIIKTKPGFSIVSSVFFMCLKDKVLAFGDCAVNPDPSAQELAEIAINSAETALTFGISAKVAMLSYSTGNSGKGEDVDKVVEATKIAQNLRPDLLIEGPLQFDSAFEPEVAAQKSPNSKIAGQATIFIFPDLNTGNNTYKAVQRTASAEAIGPVVQGLNKPVNDLSRGCNVSDIVTTVAITSIQAS